MRELIACRVSGTLAAHQTPGPVVALIGKLGLKVTTGLTGVAVEVGGAPVEVGGAPVEVGGAPVVVGGAPVELDGAPVELDGAPVEVGGAPVEVGGAPVEIGGGSVQVGQLGQVLGGACKRAWLGSSVFRLFAQSIAPVDSKLYRHRHLMSSKPFLPQR